MRENQLHRYHVLMIGTALLTCAGCSRTAPTTAAVSTPKPTASTPTTLLNASPDFVDFGTVVQGGRSEVEITLRNSGAEAVEITGTKTSCECFQIKPASDFVEPAQTVKATIVLDLSDDPKFTGKLGLEVSGQTKSAKTPAFIFRAEVKVIPQV